jgi:hypothetical protein
MMQQDKVFILEDIIPERLGGGVIPTILDPFEMLTVSPWWHVFFSFVRRWLFSFAFCLFY